MNSFKSRQFLSNIVNGFDKSSWYGSPALDFLSGCLKTSLLASLFSFFSRTRPLVSSPLVCEAKRRSDYPTLPFELVSAKALVMLLFLAFAWALLAAFSLFFKMLGDRSDRGDYSRSWPAPLPWRAGELGDSARFLTALAKPILSGLPSSISKPALLSAN